MSISVNDKEAIWAQKFRPKTVDECILPSATKAMVKGLIAGGEVPHMIFSGTAGVGKTTLAYAIANDLGCDVMYINASMERGIDMLRTRVQSFASTLSLEGDDKTKIVIMDEADGLTGDAQAAMKGFLEQFSNNCRFIFTANHKNKIIEPIQSRCVVVDFKISNSDKKDIVLGVFKRCAEILKAEGIDFDKAALAELVKRNFPDFRKTLNELQRYSSTGKIDTGVLALQGDDVYHELFGYMKEKNLDGMRRWVARNSDIEPATLFRKLYDVGSDLFVSKAIPNLIVILADYGYKAAFVNDQQINTTAALVEISDSCQFKE